MEFASRTVACWSMSNAAGPSRDGDRVGTGAVSADVATPRPCLPVRLVPPASTRPLVQVGSGEVSAVELAAAVAALGVEEVGFVTRRAASDPHATGSGSVAAAEAVVAVAVGMVDRRTASAAVHRPRLLRTRRRARAAAVAALAAAAAVLAVAEAAVVLGRPIPVFRHLA